MERERAVFDRLLQAVLTGRLNRRQVVTRAAALGLSAASIHTLGAAAAPAGTGSRGVTRAQDAGTPAPEVKTGGILKVGLQADPTSLDPHKQSLTAIWHVVEHIYNRLVKVSPSLQVEPELADSWEISPDGLTYTFNLHPGVKFHNGRVATAADVKYSFERLLDPATASPSASDLASVASIEAPSDTVVVLKLKAPDASLLSSLAGQSCIIIAREVVEANNGDISQVAVGTGPFVFKEYVPNTRIVLERNPDYFETGKPYLDGMELIPISEDTSRTTAVVTGTVDFIEYAPLRDIEILEQDQSLTLTGNENTNIRFIAINVNKPPFDNLKVRQAIAAVIDREAILGPAVFGHGTPTVTLFPESFWAAYPQPVPAPDVERAKQLLSEAGLADGFKAVIQSWAAYSFLSNAAVVVQEQLKQIGIEAELDLQENATYIENYFAHNFDLSVTGTSAYSDPNGVVFENFVTGQGSNAAGYSNPRVDELAAQGIAVTDLAQRTEIYQEIQGILLEDLPWINLFIANQYEAMKTDVKGYVHIPTGSNLSLRETWLDR